MILEAIFEVLVTALFASFFIFIGFLLGIGFSTAQAERRGKRLVDSYWKLRESMFSQVQSESGEQWKRPQNWQDLCPTCHRMPGESDL